MRNVTDNNRFIFFALLFIFISVVSFAQDKKALPPPVNTAKFSELAPSISADGKTLIFESDRQGDWKLFESKKTGKLWSVPVPIARISSTFYENAPIGAPCISYDGNYLFFSATSKDATGREDIYMSTRDATGGWSAPQRLNTAINTNDYEGYPSLSPDGKKLFFARAKYNTLDKKDNQLCYKLMVSEKDASGNWQTATELPSPLNLSCEKSPRIMPDGKTLVFASVRKEGLGNFDLYRSELQENGRWSEVKALSFINTSDADLFAAVAACGDLMYFVKDNDIYTVEAPFISSQTIQGVLTDSLSNQAVATKIAIYDITSNSRLLTSVTSNSADGHYLTVLSPQKKYLFEIQDKKYALKRVVVDLSNKTDCESVTQNIKLSPIVATAPTPEVSENQPKAREGSLKVSFQAVDDHTSFVLPATMTLTEKKSSQSVSLINNAITSQFHASIAAGVDYELTVSMKGYRDQKQLVRFENTKDVNPVTIVRLESLAPNYTIKAIDAKTNTALKTWKAVLTEQFTNQTATIESDPQTGVSKTTLVSGKKYKLVIQSDLFEETEQVFTKSDDMKEVSLKLIPRRVSTINFKAFDNDSQAPIYASFKVKTKKAGKTFEGSTNATNEFFTVNLTGNDNLKIEVNADGYLPVDKEMEISDLVLGDRRISIINLMSDKYPLTIRILDADTKQLIKEATVKIADLRTGEMKPTLKGNNGEFKANMKRTGSFEVFVKAENYIGISQKIEDMPEGGTLSFMMSRRKTIPVVFSVIDGHTNKPVVANLTIKLEKALMTEHIKERSEAEVKVTEKEVFTVETSALTYKQKQSTFNMADFVEGKKYNYIIRLEKAYSLITVKAIDKNTQEKIEVDSYAIYDLSDRASRPEVVRGTDGNATASLLPENKYRIELTAQGYERFSLEFSNLGISDLVCRMVRQAKDLTVSFSAKDSTTQKPLEAIFKIYKINMSPLAQGMTVSGKMEYKMTLPALDSYEVEVFVKGYNPKKERITFTDPEKQKVFTLWMSRDYSLLSVKVINAETKGVLKDAVISLVDAQTNKPVSAIVTLPNGEVSANLKPGSVYKLKVSMPNYEVFESDIQATIEDLKKDIELKPFQQYKLQLYAIDAVKKHKVPAQVKVLLPSGDIVAQGTTDSRNEFLNVTLLEKINYTIEVKADGYKLYDGRFIPDASMKGEKAKTAIWLEKEALLSFRVLDAQTKAVIPSVKAKLVDLKSNQELPLSSQGDDFMADLSPVTSYQLDIQAIGYVSYSARVEPASANKKREILLNKSNEAVVAQAPVLTATPVATPQEPATIEKIETGKSFVLNHVYFEQSSFILRKDSYPELDKVVAMLKENPLAKIEIAGHTDNVGDPRLNKALSENRAKVILNYFVSKGINEARLSYKGYGGTNPVAPNDNEDNKKKNRRVEIVGVQ